MTCTVCGTAIEATGATCPRCGAQGTAPGRPTRDDVLPQHVAHLPDEPVDEAITQDSWDKPQQSPAWLASAEALAANTSRLDAQRSGRAFRNIPPATPTYVGSEVVRRLKTSMDTVCGAVFLPLGLLCLAVFGLYAYGTYTTRGVDGFLPLLLQVTVQNVALSLFTLRNVLGMVAGLLLVAAGLVALIKGKGRSPAYAGLVLLLFGLLFDGIYYYLLHRQGLLAGSITQAVVANWPLHLLQLGTVVAIMVLLPLKRRAKARARRLVPPGYKAAGAAARRAPHRAGDPAGHTVPGAKAASAGTANEPNAENGPPDGPG